MNRIEVATEESLDLFKEKMALSGEKLSEVREAQLKEVLDKHKAGFSDIPG